MDLNKLKIAVLPGDGIGIEVTEAALPIFTALDLPVSLHRGEIGWSCWQKEGTPIPERTWDLIHECDTVLLGAITSKPQREAQQELAPELRECGLNYISPIILLRQNLDLYANVRPCFSIQASEKPFNFCIIRENTEGLYAGFDYAPPPDALLELLAKKKNWQQIPAKELSCALRVQSTAGLTRLFEFAFHYAKKQQMQRVTFADKPNVLRLSGHFAREIFESIAQKYPDIHADILNVDAVGLWLIRRPEEFGVIVAENMFGDILSDVGAGVMGGLGFAPSANIGKKQCYFEPVHGSGPQMHPQTANPSAMFLTVSLLLKQFGYEEQAKLISESVRTIINKGRFVTYDVGGKSSTTDMANAIIDQCLGATKSKHQTPTLNEESTMDAQLKKLYAYNTTEISDALDACHVEGALLHIKALAPGMKMVGPAYTVRYAANEQKSSGFKNAANYIDAVPEQSIIVIDNEGRIDCTAWGAILTKMALHMNIAGTLVNGAVRDVDFIREANYPLFCAGTYMRSGKNRIHKVAEQCPLVINEITIHPGDIIFADDNGALVIPKQLVAEVIEKAEKIKCTEFNIAKAIQEGSSLEQARIDYRYDQPWLGAKKK
ncbi:isocitrate/isopropylmalate family dehydrogenase [Legionella saoudiensis]|uniref:isocitrate/isopropylmalate family dehydrogenase n=1 Tax=Legionella saoudiensis TaxID=1750561 RepID=UPI000730E407|nr:isocitrate/isopropylmalate family dehydrogenase [Legionella saoudiensis]